MSTNKGLILILKEASNRAGGVDPVAISQLTNDGVIYALGAGEKMREALEWILDFSGNPHIQNRARGALKGGEG